MNYYKITNIPKNKYILSYDIKKDIIIIKLANNENYVVRNTTNNENKILERMNKQVSSIMNNPVNTNLLNNVVIYGSGLISLSALLYKLIDTIITLISGSFSTLSLLIVTLMSLSSLVVFTTMKRYYNEQQDLKKIKLYCEAKQLLNTSIKDSSKNVFNRVSFKASKQIKNRHMEEEPFTINSINKMSLKDLQTLKENMEREQEFGLEERPIVYKTKLKRKKFNRS